MDDEALTGITQSQRDRCDREIPLSGGRISTGVVRVGATVRRPTTAASPFVAKLLDTVHRNGFTGAPRYLGRDGAARDVFDHVAGEVPARLRRFRDDQVTAAGALLRGFHDATRGSALAGTCPAVCHHDPGPYNVVFRSGWPVALIDFDTAAPGDPLCDIGYAAWLWCVRSTGAPARAQAAQVRALTDGYRLDPLARLGVVDAMLDAQSRNIRFWRDRRGDGRAAEMVAWSRREQEHTAAHRETFTAALAH